ncbi:hypothetical protein FJSC11DRAFT_2090 [Fischerella thermalis JSC-11]|jgi:hypothetical protein|uniref:Uncharacterized protein n=1 Tax=Fischerella thermalis JSC-11 TaxID=741277 RepID=G6FT93_9CYAN|nr:hypothetical protein FJSC11DRAFT_2090 [Fischerella thermalis JSC-11]
MNIFTLVLDLICVKIVYILSNTDEHRWTQMYYLCDAYSKTINRLL